MAPPPGGWKPAALGSRERRLNRVSISLSDNELERIEAWRDRAGRRETAGVIRELALATLGDGRMAHEFLDAYADLAPLQETLSCLAGRIDGSDDRWHPLRGPVLRELRSTVEDTGRILRELRAALLGLPGDGGSDDR